MVPGDEADGISYVGGVPSVVINGAPVFLTYAGTLGWGYYDQWNNWQGAPPQFVAHMDQFHPDGAGLPGFQPAAMRPGFAEGRHSGVVPAAVRGGSAGQAAGPGGFGGPGGGYAHPGGAIGPGGGFGHPGGWADRVDRVAATRTSAAQVAASGTRAEDTAAQVAARAPGRRIRRPRWRLRPSRRLRWRWRRVPSRWPRRRRGWVPSRRFAAAVGVPSRRRRRRGIRSRWWRWRWRPPSRRWRPSSLSRTASSPARSQR